MKLKTSPLFFLSLFYKQRTLVCLFCIYLLGGFFSQEIRANDNDQNIPGLIEGLEKLQRLSVDQFKNLQNNPNKISITPSDLEQTTELKLDPILMRSLLFHSESKYFSLIQRDECKFYSLLESNLLKSSEDKIETLNVILKLKSGETKSGIMAKNIFFEELYKRRCFNNREYAILFNEKNFQKTISGIKFSIPKGENACASIHSEWIINSYTPYLCRIAQVLKINKTLTKEQHKAKLSEDEEAIKQEAENYLQKISLLQRNYIEDLCQNLNRPQSFCSQYLKEDIWNKVISGEASAYKLNYKCANILNQSVQLSLKDQKSCTSKFNSDPNICVNKGNRDLSSYFPMQNCDQTSKALLHSRLVTEYHDCPGNIDNEAITNVHRIVNHFKPRQIKESSSLCMGEANYSFARLNIDIKHEKGWPLKICYLSRFENKEECTQYIPGSRENEPLSEDQVISKILYLHKGAPPKLKCSIVSSKKYNPLRTDYKAGCFIVYDAESCTTLSCNKKVIWENEEQKDMRFIGTPIFEYFPSSFSNERYSVQNMLNEVLNLQTRTIKNLTDLKFYLDKIPSGIIHGVGCAEDLLPETFTRMAINQCHPMPFLIDGYLIQNGEVLIVTRSAIDDLFSPRLLPWHIIYNGVSAYKELHPLNTWTLYGLKK